MLFYVLAGYIKQSKVYFGACKKSNTNENFRKASGYRGLNE